MKGADWPGFTDLRQKPEAAKICRCGCAEVRLEKGLCLACLLANGLSREEGGTGSPIDFTDIPDGHWRLGGYELLDEIGRGGMGIIYRARQPHSNRIVALKRILPQHGSSPETAARMRREAESVARLDHPHVLPIYEVGTDAEGLPFFSMKLAGGGSLQQARGQYRGETRKVVELMRKVARAVQHAHGEGILHRDLKPGNILLDGQGQPLVADFGMAKWMGRDADLTQTLTVFGTPGYIAPEQAGGPSRDLTAAADIYSLGAILFELLAGRPPFIGENAWAVVQAADTTPAPKLRAIMPRVDHDLETICARCLERDPKARYKNAGDLADDLQRWLDNRPILARPVSSMEHGWRWVRRNRVLTGVGLVCLLLAGITLAWQIKSTRLNAQLLQQARLASAIGILPVLDLDTVTTDSGASQRWTTQLTSLFSAGNRLVKAGDPAPRWSKNYAALARERGVHFLVTGLTRQTPAGRRLVLHWFDANEGRFTRWIEATVPEGGEAAVEPLVRELLAGGGRSVANIDAAAKTSSQEARDLLANGENYYSRRTEKDYEKAATCARSAIAADPGYAAAYTLLARSLSVLGGMRTVEDKEGMREAEAAIKKAVELSPDSAGAFRAQAGLYYRTGRMAESLEASYRNMEIGLDFRISGTLAGSICRTMGKLDQALAWYDWASLFEELPGENLRAQADILMMLDEFSLAESYYRRYASLFPDQPEGLLGICILRILQGNDAEAENLIQKLTRNFPNSSHVPLVMALEVFYKGDFAAAATACDALIQQDALGESFYGGCSTASRLGYSLRQIGQEEKGCWWLEQAEAEARKRIDPNAPQPDQLYDLAGTLAALGSKDAALDCLEKALAAGLVNRCFLVMDPEFTSIRNEPRFGRILRALEARIGSLKRNVPTVENGTTTQNNQP